MPKSDTWPGAIVSDTMKEMDSAGSCDSVVSINSAFSDDSLDYLTDEEKACLMFLEQTIEALETEEDSGLSNDEPDIVPMPVNLAARMANLSASMSKSKMTDASICHKVEVVKNNNKHGQDHNQILNYLVPTPLVLANGSSSVLSKAKNGVVTKGGRSPKPARPALNSQAPADHSVYIVMVPEPEMEKNGSVNTAEEELERTGPRGPLSYEALVQLRKAACVRKAQETCATLEDKDKQASKPIKHLPRDDDGSHAPTDQSGVRKPAPPAVAPKPKRLPPSIPISPTAPQTDMCLTNPQRVRMEALYKLGLLKDQDSSSTVPSKSQPDHSRPPAFPPPPPPRASKPAPSKADPTPPAVDPRARETTHWTSGVVHHRSMSDLTPGPQPLPTRPGGGKSVTLERSGLGLGSSITSQSFCDRKEGAKNNLLPRVTANGVAQINKPRSRTLDSLGDSSGPGRVDRSASFQRWPQDSGVKGHKHSQSAAHSVQMLPPRMAEERREALRKLGLLKD